MTQRGLLAFDGLGQQNHLRLAPIRGRQNEGPGCVDREEVRVAHRDHRGSHLSVRSQGEQPATPDARPTAAPAHTSNTFRRLISLLLIRARRIISPYIHKDPSGAVY